MWKVVLLFVFAYLLGGIPWGLLLIKTFKGIDFRTIGSGNIGATNAIRAGGLTLGVITFILDSAKGFLPTILAIKYTGNLNLSFLIGFTAVLGHMFTPYLKFKGGKGVATGIGVLIAIAPKSLLVGTLIWLVILFTFRYVSLASISGAFGVAVTMPLFYPHQIFLIVLGFILFGLILIRHKSNIKRILAGTEPKVNFIKRR